MLVCRDSHIAPLHCSSDGPYTVLKWSACFFTIQKGDPQKMVYMKQLKSVTAADMPPADPPKRGRPPDAAVNTATAAHSAPAQCQDRLRHGQRTYPMRFTLPSYDQ